MEPQDIYYNKAEYVETVISYADSNRYISYKIHLFREYLVSLEKQKYYSYFKNNADKSNLT